MSTHSKIIIKDQNGGYKGIYCHFDGYLSGVGEVLRQHYTGQEKVERLIALGSISQLHDLTEAPDDKWHSYDRPWPGVTVAYHRDRGEDLDIDSAGTLSEIADQEYNYLYDDGSWFLVKGNALVKLTETLGE